LDRLVPSPRNDRFWRRINRSQRPSRWAR